MSDKAKVYPKAGSKSKSPIRVWLSWKGKRYHRDEYILFNKSLKLNRESADRLASAINTDIDDKQEDFDPRDWFNADKELQFSYAVDKWYELKTFSPGTYRNVECALEKAKDFFGNRNIKSLRKAHLKNYLKTFNGLALSYQRTLLNWLKSALNEICDDWGLTRVPFPTVSVPHKEPDWLTREEQDIIIDKVPSSDRPIFEFLKAYGCRISEACALTWDAINWNKNEIVFKQTFSGNRNVLKDTTKSGYHRKAPMTSAIVGLLRPLRMDISSKFVFKNSSGSHYIRGSLWERWRKATDKTDIRYVSLENAMRHSKNNQLKSQGYDIKMRSEFLGHRRISTTEIYDAVDVNHFKEMVG